MTSFDLFIVSLIGVSAMFAWLRGFSREIVTLLAIGVGALAVLFFGTAFSTLFGTGVLGPLIGLTLLFLIGFVLASVILEMVVSKFFGGSPHLYDKIGGAVFGVVRGWFLVGLSYLALTYYFEEANLPPAIEGALLKPVTTSAAGLLEKLGLEREATDPESIETDVLDEIEGDTAAAL